MHVAVATAESDFAPGLVHDNAALHANSQIQCLGIITHGLLQQTKTPEAREMAPISFLMMSSTQVV